MAVQPQLLKLLGAEEVGENFNDRSEGKRFALKIKIISDTTCDLPEQLLKEYQITLLPLHITKGEESLLDGV